MSEFLGPRGKATVILMKAHFDTELPKLRDLKRILSIPDGRYYKSRGNFSNSIHRLTDLLGIVARIEKTGKKQSDFRSSDFLITVAEVHSNLFMKLQYDAEVIEGFNLTEQNFDQLANLIDHFYEIHSMIQSVQYMSRNHVCYHFRTAVGLHIQGDRSPTALSGCWCAKSAQGSARC